MEEKNKRFRPSLTAYRALEKELAELRQKLAEYTGEPTRRQYEDECFDQHCEIEELRRKLDSQIEGTSTIVTESNAWREKYRDLKVKYDAAVKRAKEASADYNKARREVLWLRGRNLWQRLLNDQYEE